MGELSRQELESRLAEAQRATEYYRQISIDTANKRVREAEELSELISRQKKTEKALLGRDAILEAVGFAAEQFMKKPDIQGAMQDVLARLGEATAVCRGYVFRNFLSDDDTIMTSQIHEWCAPGIEPQLENPALQNLSYMNAGFGSWVNCLSRGQPVVGLTETFPADEKAFLQAQSIMSILVVPIFVGAQWWGFVGFDDCRNRRKWQPTEIDALKVAAGIFGAAIQQDLDRKRIEAANRAKSQFLANMSHELRTPLNHIIGFSELVADERMGPLNDLQKEYMNDVLQSGKHLLDLINDVLDLSKIESGKMELTVSRVHLRHLLEGAPVMIKENALRHGITVEIGMDASLPEEIPADERKLKQILFNLLSNAVKFTPPNGKITLRGELLSWSGTEWQTRAGGMFSPGTGISIPENECKNWVKISLADTGIGIAPRDRIRIFEAFEQVDNSASRRFQGTGLGLSLSRDLAKLHNGMLWAESGGEGCGSEFILLLPVAGADPEGRQDDCQ